MSADSPDPVVRADATTPHDEKYLPAPKAARSGIGLCLSGGGFRATLFHLGALRRLNELGVLGQLRTITSVSGGSIMSAVLAAALAEPAGMAAGRLGDFEGVARRIRAFTSADRRTWPILNRLLPWNWFDDATGVKALMLEYETDLTRLRIGQLPEAPNFIFCATDMAFGVDWTFQKRASGDYQAGYIAPTPPEWPVAKAVAASSCFPPVFNPLPIGLKPTELKGGDYYDDGRDKCIEHMRLTDGGDYDNFGLEPVWKDHSVVLVSDGGSPFQFEGDKGLKWRLLRYADIAQEQARALRKRWLISSFATGVMQGTYWGIRSARTSYDPTDAIGYSDGLAKQVISKVRTDLNAFSDAEAAVLENHGYLLADAAIKKHVPALYGSAQPPVVPHPDWLDEQKVRTALHDSAKRTLFFLKI
ncbi:MAG: patatin-like phospholipase family protein [Gemmatimonadota bacterium]|nr:patatin-like phospholipase family protein [Gemmatimonadota bacterium]